MHSITELKQKQSLSLESKIIMSKQRIKAWHEYFNGEVYVSFSGGKDSTVLMHLVKSMYNDVKIVFCDTGLEYPEVREFARKNADIVIKPKKNFKKVIEQYGYPIISKEQAQYINQYRNARSEKTKQLRLNGNNGSYKISEKYKYLINAPFKISEKCCDIMKKQPFKQFEKETNLKPIIATMAEESSLRQNTWLKYGCNAFNSKRQISKPLSFWTEQDILKYIDINNLEIAKCYGELKKDCYDNYYLTKLNRTGCMFCMFGIQTEKDTNRFERMAKDYPTQYKYCLEKLGIKNVLEYMKIPYIKI